MTHKRHSEINWPLPTYPIGRPNLWAVAWSIIKLVSNALAILILVDSFLVFTDFDLASLPSDIVANSLEVDLDLPFSLFELVRFRELVNFATVDNLKDFLGVFDWSKDFLGVLGSCESLDGFNKSIAAPSEWLISSFSEFSWFSDSSACSDSGSSKLNATVFVISVVSFWSSNHWSIKSKISSCSRFLGLSIVTSLVDFDLVFVLKRKQF